jgi:hypothetical protein
MLKQGGIWWSGCVQGFLRVCDAWYLTTLAPSLLNVCVSLANARALVEKGLCTKPRLSWPGERICSVMQLFRKLRRSWTLTPTGPSGRLEDRNSNRVQQLHSFSARLYLSSGSQLRPPGPG